MDSFDLSLYPASVMAYPDALRRTPPVSAAQGVEGVAAPMAVGPVQSTTEGPAGQAYTPRRRESRPARLRRETPPSAYGAYSLSFDNVLAQYRRS